MLPDSNILGYSGKHQGLYCYLRGEEIYHIIRTFSNKINFSYLILLWTYYSKQKKK